MPENSDSSPRSSHSPISRRQVLAGAGGTGAVVNTLRPRPVTTTDIGVFDTSHGTVHLILGCGGTDAPLDEYGPDTADGQHQAKVFTRADRPVPSSTPGVFRRAAADAVEDAIRSRPAVGRPALISRTGVAR